MIKNFIDSVLLIDDSKSEIEKLESFFKVNDIRVDFYSPTELDSKKDNFKNRKLIIIDLFLVDSDTLVNNIARIRKYFTKFLGKQFGNYGVVLWTKHVESLDEFRDKIKLDKDFYSLPLFIIGLDKTKYIAAGNYDDVIQDLEIEIEKNAGANFFVRWDSLVSNGKDSAINQIFDLVKDYKKQDEDLKFILLKLAQNYTGIPVSKLNEHSLEHDAIKAMSDMLHYEITSSFNTKSNLFDNIEAIKFSGDSSEQFKIFAKLNSRLLLDFTNINQKTVIPGSVYEIIKKDNSNIIQEVSHRESGQTILTKVKDVLKNVKDIIIEVTPPCDFSNDKKSKRSRFISGLMFDYDKEAKKYFSGDGFYTELFPINIQNDVNMKMIVFDFKFFNSINENELEDVNSYKILYRVKDKLFSDILQKLSSHIARLGLPIIR
jgi:hypothetical protein